MPPPTGQDFEHLRAPERVLCYFTIVAASNVLGVRLGAAGPRWSPRRTSVNEPAQAGFS